MFFTLALVNIFICNSCTENNPTETKNQNIINTWVNVTNGIPSASYQIASIGNNIYVAAYFPQSANFILYSSSNDGESWETLGNGLPDSTSVNGISGWSNYVALATSSKGVYISSDYGETWIKPANNGLESEYVYSIKMDSLFLYAGAGNDAKIFRSSDLGNNWTAFDNGLPIRTPQFYPRILVIAENNNLFFACPFASGIYSSNDNGENWQSMNEGLPDHSWVFSFTASDSFYFAYVMAQAIQDYGVYRCEHNSRNWIKMPIALTDYAPHFVVAKGQTVVASIDSMIEISFNNGNTWADISKGLNNTKSSLFYYAIVHDNYVFAADIYNGIWRYHLR